jgi:hypothetical protein
MLAVPAGAKGVSAVTAIVCGLPDYFTPDVLARSSGMPRLMRACTCGQVRARAGSSENGAHTAGTENSTGARYRNPALRVLAKTGYGLSADLRVLLFAVTR